MSDGLLPLSSSEDDSDLPAQPTVTPPVQSLIFQPPSFPWLAQASPGHQKSRSPRTEVGAKTNLESGDASAVPRQPQKPPMTGQSTAPSSAPVDRTVAASLSMPIQNTTAAAVEPADLLPADGSHLHDVATPALSKQTAEHCTGKASSKVTRQSGRMSAGQKRSAPSGGFPASPSQLAGKQLAPDQPSQGRRKAHKAERDNTGQAARTNAPSGDTPKTVSPESKAKVTQI